MPLTSRITFLTVAQNVETQILGPNPRRFLLGLSSDNAGPVYLRNDSIGNKAGGINIVNTSGQYEYPYYKYGDLLKNPFFIYHNISGGVIIGIIEVES